MLEGLEILGNATVVPAVIFLTQLLKKRVGKVTKYRSDIVALALSLVLCMGFTFYDMAPADFAMLGAGSILVKFKWGVDQLVIGFATWLAASKVYDLGHGDKKRKRVVSKERTELQKEIVKLKNGNGDPNGQAKTKISEDDVLRKILEG